MSRPTTRPVPIRLDALLIMRLDRAARRLGVNNRSAVMRLAIVQQLSQIESGIITLAADTETG